MFNRWLAGIAATVIAGVLTFLIIKWIQELGQTNGPPPQSIPQISGEWKSSETNKEFKVSQSGRRFTWKYQGEKYGSGEILGNSPSDFKITLKLIKGQHSGKTVIGNIEEIINNRITKINFHDEGTKIYRID